MTNTRMEDIAEAVGGDIVVELIRCFAGHELHIPRKAKDGHRLHVALGQTNASALCEYMGGETVRIPSRYGSRTVNRITAARDALVVQRIKGGDLRSDIAYDYGITVRTVYNINAAFKLAEARLARMSAENEAA